MFVSFCVQMARPGAYLSFRRSDLPSVNLILTFGSLKKLLNFHITHDDEPTEKNHIMDASHT
jgi:hypothetical protein